MKNLLHATVLASFLFLLATNNIYAQQPKVYSKVGMDATDAPLQNLVGKGLSVDEVLEKTHYNIVGEISPFNKELTHGSGFKDEVLITDVEADFQNRNKLEINEAQIAAATNATSEGFNYGSISTCWVASDYFEPSIPAGTNGCGTSFNLPVSIINYGLQNGTVETVSFITTDERVTKISAPVSLQNLAFDGILNSTINLTFAANAAPGAINGILQVTTASGCNLNYPVRFMYNGDCAPLPTNWTSGDVGATGITGSVCYAPPLFTVKGSGTGIESSADQFQLVKTAINDNYTIVARINSVTNTSAGAKAGIVIAETTATGSKRVSLMLVPSSGMIEFQIRSKPNGNVLSSTVSGSAPGWLKLIRNRSTFSGYYSIDGINWTLVKQVNLTLTTSAFAGLAVTSGVNTALCTGIFENVNVSSSEQDASVKMDSKIAGTLEAELSLYPNPSSWHINVTLPAQGKTADIEIQDVSGRVVKRYTNLNSVFQRFDVTNFKGGVYIIKAMQDNKIYSKQFVIVR